MYWEHCTASQINELDKSIPVLLPIAAIEQHGTHLPVSTDKMIGVHFCDQVNEKIPDEVLILPMLSIGCSEHHKAFGGTLSLTHDTFLNQLKEVATCVAENGFQNIVVLNSHGGNQAIGQSFVEVFGYRNPGVNVFLITWWRLALDALAKLDEPERGSCGHAGAFETSLMLHIAPELVHMDQAAAKSNVPTFEWAEGDLLRGPAISYYRTIKDMTPNGVYGDPTLATTEKGQAISSLVTGKLVEILGEIRKR